MIGARRCTDMIIDKRTRRLALRHRLHCQPRQHPPDTLHFFLQALDLPVAHLCPAIRGMDCGGQQGEMLCQHRCRFDVVCLDQQAGAGQVAEQCLNRVKRRNVRLHHQ